jgi:uncharacterized membrane protein
MNRPEQAYNHCLISNIDRVLQSERLAWSCTVITAITLIVSLHKASIQSAIGGFGFLFSSRVLDLIFYGPER